MSKPTSEADKIHLKNKFEKNEKKDGHCVSNLVH